MGAEREPAAGEDRGVPAPRGPLLESYSAPGGGFERFERHGMGTANVLLLRGAEEEAGGRAFLGKAAQEAFTILERLEEALSKFLPESEVSRLNAAAAASASGGGSVRVGEDLWRLLELSREAWQLTGGAFDPTVGRLMEAWGFVDRQGRVPGEREVEALAAARGMDRVILDAASRTARLASPAVAIDLGAIAKGYAADRMAARLRRLGVPAGAVICGRSSIVAWGAPPGEERWRFEVAHPRAPEEALATLLVEPGAVSSSGAYERSFRRGAREYGHVLDPRSGRPAAAVASATVWTESALLGDVLSTALFVGGRGLLSSGGGLVELARRWSPGGTGRFTALLVEEDPGVWGGLRTFAWHSGAPAFVEVTGETAS